MPFFPEIPTWDTSTINTQTFLGLNRGLSVEDGEMVDMENLSSDNFPVLATRQGRGVPVYNTGDTGLTAFPGSISGMLGTDRLIVCAGEKVYMDGVEVPIALSAEEHMQPKHLVSMGSYVCIWPDKKYFSVSNASDYGDMGSKWTAAQGETVSAMMCRKDGTDYEEESITVSGKAPDDPEDQQLWLDTSGETDTLKQFSKTHGEWVSVATTYIKIQADGIGKAIKDGDVVHLSGVRHASEETATVSQEEQTLSFAAPDVSLYSSYETVNQGGSVVSTEAYTNSKTITIKVEGIPDGATVTGAKLHFTTNRPDYGAKKLTVNGVKFTDGQPGELDIVLNGNGDVNVNFVFQSGNWSTVVGKHGGTVTFSGIRLDVMYSIDSTGADERDAKQLDMLNTTNAVYERGDNYIVVAGLLRRATTLADTLVVEMKIPDLDYVCEANNRLWGCSYTTADGTTTNEIRCCALGDFRNWYKFEGTSMDSYVMSVGSDGPFTAAYTLHGMPLMFKEDFLHKISGTQPSNFTLNTIKCRGVQDGSWRSLAVVNETLMYKARHDVMAYDGATPYAVGEKLGPARYYDAVGGSYRDKYYVSMRDKQMVRGTYVFDTARNLWHKEDDSAIAFMASADGVLVLAVQDGETTNLRTVGGDNASETFKWSATFGVFGYAFERAKYLSRFNIRAQLGTGSEMHFEIMYDSSGKWERVGTLKAKTLQTFTLPIIPHRCDHCQVRISGTGHATIYSIARVFEEGGN